MKRRITITFIVLIVTGFLVVGIGFIRPAMPKEWKTIAAGMSRDAILKQIPGHVSDMRELKGFDIALREFEQWGIRKCWWQLQIHYDQEGLAKSLMTSFTDPNCGLYNTKWTPME